MSQIDLIKIYNPANQTKQQLIKNFVVRLELFQEIFEAVKSSKMDSPEQHYIIQGIRGQGKTTMLLRLVYEIQNDPKLNNRLIPVIFSEEQYSLRKLYKLWELTAVYLKDEPGFESLVNDMQNLNYDEDYEVNCFQLLENRLKKNKKKLVLFIDNINDMFDKFKKKDCQRLREVLLQTSELRIIGSSSVSLEFHYQYNEPFYEFFRMPRLKGLSQTQTRTLLLKLGEHYQSETVKKIVTEQPGRIEALRILTGGVIRTIILLFNIFVDEEDGNAFNDLEEVLDQVTPLYKNRMDNLSPQQQEIMDFIALSWDAVSTNEIAAKVKEESKAVSAQLKQLTKNNLIEVQITKTKNNLYRISERFFNIWYLMRHGGRNEENKVKFLVEFLQGWCDDETLEDRAKKHLEALIKGKINEKHAFYMTEAFNLTSLKSSLRDQIIEETKRYLTKIKSELLDSLHYSDMKLKELATESLNKEDLDQYVKHLEDIRFNDDNCFLQIGMMHGFTLHHPDLAEQYFLLAVEKGNVEAMKCLAFFYKDKLKDFAKAEKYYLMVSDRGIEGVLNSLSWMLFKNAIKKDKALIYSKKQWKLKKNMVYAHTYASILLWNNEIEKAIEISKEFLADKEANDIFPEDIRQFLMLLIAKKQYHSVYKIFNENSMHFKDRFKPLYYALMYFLQEEYPNEYLRMGSELRQTVEEIIVAINKMSEKYA